MANSIPKIITPPDVGQAAPAQVALDGAVASRSDKAASDATVKPTPAINADDASTSADQAASANLRLEIEDDKAAGCFVYKIINRATGEIVQQIPQEQIVKLRESDGYMAGDVIKAQA